MRKIKIPVEDDPQGYEAEWLWASRRLRGYSIENSPFSAYGLSFRDIVSAENKGGELVFKSILEKRGHRTIRIKLPVGKVHRDFMLLWPQLEAVGCTFEGSQTNGPLYAVDVPPTVDKDTVLRILWENENKGNWEFEEVDFY